jgi:hypothetical protein
MKSKDAPYQCYLVRFWRIDNAGHQRPEGAWRASVQEPGSETQISFEHPAALWAYLAAQLGLAKVEEKANAEQI